MSWTPKKKRFWDKASCELAGDGFGIHLDGRPLQTPAKAPLTVPTRAMAQAIVDEWLAQTANINPETMPVTRAANAAIDKIMPQHDAVADGLAAYGETDLLCYRADFPQTLRTRQDAAWDPLLDWAAQALGARLHPVTGVSYVPQDAVVCARLKQRVLALDSFTIAGFHDLVGLSGSLVIGFAALSRAFPIDDLWCWSRIDEDWQTEQWGADEWAAKEKTAKRRDFLRAQHFLGLCFDGS